MLKPRAVLISTRSLTRAIFEAVLYWGRALTHFKQGFIKLDCVTDPDHKQDRVLKEARALNKEIQYPTLIKCFHASNFNIILLNFCIQTNFISSG